MYRESEAQTIPYTPDYTFVNGVVPEVMLLKDLTFENGLPIGKKRYVQTSIHIKRYR
jgi:hypothetical protein